MKKVIALLLVLFVFSIVLTAYSYPPTFVDLLTQYKDQKEQVIIFTTKSYSGEILICAEDYIVFKTTSGDVVVIPLSAITEVGTQ